MTTSAEIDPAASAAEGVAVRAPLSAAPVTPATDGTDETAADAAGPFRCTTSAAARHEPMFATASRVDRWLLVEQAGPWGPESVPSGRMTPEAYAGISRLARESGARLLLIRRPSSSDASEQTGVMVYLVESRVGHESVMSRRLTGSDELAGLAPPPRDPAWVSEDEPLFLVCTHGRHDPCCALFGRPVASAMCGREPERTWECTHVGGDRFGANVVVLPQGLYLGRVIPGRVGEVVDAVRARRIPLELLRGRSCYSMVVQAAQHFARGERDGTQTPADGFDDLAPVSEVSAGAGQWRVTLADGSAQVAVTVRRELSAEPVRLTCHAPEPRTFPGFRLVGVERLAAA